MGYWQVAMDADTQEKAAFVLSSGFHGWNVMPFGLCKAPRAFTRLMDLVLKDLHWQICLIYLDEVVVMGRTFGKELEHWKQVFERLSRAGLKLKPMKTFVFQKQKWVLFLKHVVTEGSHRGRHRCRSCKGRAGLHVAHSEKQRGGQKLSWTCLLPPLIRP